MHDDALPAGQYTGRKDTAMKFTNAEELRAHIWTTLHLDTRSIVFHVLELDDGLPYYERDLIDAKDGLYDSDEFFEYAYAHSEDQEIHVDSVVSYMIGDGESELADYGDVEELADIAVESPAAMTAFLSDTADVLAVLRDFDLDNPCYEELEDDGVDCDD